MADSRILTSMSVFPSVVYVVWVEVSKENPRPHTATSGLGRDKRASRKQNLRGHTRSCQRRIDPESRSLLKCYTLGASLASL